MTERPIIFGTTMMRALLAGRKTQTRRVVKPQPKIVDRDKWPCPYGAPGDRLWVRETWALGAHASAIVYRADGEFAPGAGRWRPSIHLSRKLARITLELTDVRVQRVQEISQFDAMQEGFDGPDHKANFCKLWDTINAKRGYQWASNPWVWALTFKVVKPTMDTTKGD